MKGIILAAGLGTRLYPITKIISKHLLPIYNKPMIYYPMSTLMLMGIRDILIITNKNDISESMKLFGNGERLGINIEYAVQENPRGIADAFIIGEHFIGNDNVCLILCDNIFWGINLSKIFIDNLYKIKDAVIFGYKVDNPNQYGVVEFDKEFNIISLEEKPSNPESNYAVVGIYFYTNSVINIAKKLKPSNRGELEITDINRKYLEMNKLRLVILPQNCIWFDMGSHDSLLKSSQTIRDIEKKYYCKIGCIEDIAYNNGWICNKTN